MTHPFRDAVLAEETSSIDDSDTTVVVLGNHTRRKIDRYSQYIYMWTRQHAVEVSQVSGCLDHLSVPSWRESKTNKQTVDI